MPLAPQSSMALVGTTAAQDLSLYVGGRDLGALLDLPSVSIQDAGSSARATASMRIKTSMVAAPEIYDQALLQLYSSVENVDIFRGFIRSRHPMTDIAPMLDLIADDIGGLLDDTFIPFEQRPAETMAARIGYLWGVYAGPFLSGDLSNVAAIGGTLPNQSFAGVSLRLALEITISQASASAGYYVDPLGRLFVFTAAGAAAPYDVVTGTPAGGQIAPEDLDIDYDSNTYFNRVYVQGATPAGSGFFKDDAAIAAANGLIRTGVLQAPDCETKAMATSLAAMYLGRVSSATPQGKFSASSPYDGWRGGQTVNITESNIGLSAEPFRIMRVTITFQRTHDSYRRKYEVRFGGSGAGSQGIHSESLGSGQLVSGNLGGASNVYVTGDGVAVTDGT